MSGRRHWIGQRVSALALVPLAVWFLAGLLSRFGGGYEAARDWIGHPGNALLFVAFIVVGFVHIQMGLRVVIEDYVALPGRKAVLRVNTVLCTLVAVAGIAAVGHIVFSGVL